MGIPLEAHAPGAGFDRGLLLLDERSHGWVPMVRAPRRCKDGSGRPFPQPVDYKHGAALEYWTHAKRRTINRLYLLALLRAEDLKVPIKHFPFEPRGESCSGTAGQARPTCQNARTVETSVEIEQEGWFCGRSNAFLRRPRRREQRRQQQPRQFKQQLLPQQLEQLTHQLQKHKFKEEQQQRERRQIRAPGRVLQGLQVEPDVRQGPTRRLRSDVLPAQGW